MKVLRNLQLLNGRLVVMKDDNCLRIPLSRKLTENEVTMLRQKLKTVTMTMCDFEERQRRVKSLNEVLVDQLPPHLLMKIPRSMDVVGHVAVVEVPPELEVYKKIVGKAILSVNKSVRTILAKASAVGGKSRLRRFERLAGAHETETVYKEYGCIYRLDLRKVYFSPRLSQERWRIAQKVRENEVVVDLFAGVGPFSIQIAKRHSDAKVYAIDANPSAVQFLKRNVILNKVDNVFPLHGDAREIVEKYLIGKADRVIMNLPKKAIEYIDVACKTLRPSGGIIHYYGFEAAPHALEKAEMKIKEAIAKMGRSIRKILDSRLVRSTAPHEWQIVVDASVS